MPDSDDNPDPNILVDPTDLERFIHGFIDSSNVLPDETFVITHAMILYHCETMDGQKETMGYVTSNLDQLTTLGMIHAARLYVEQKINKTPNDPGFD